GPVRALLPGRLAADPAAGAPLRAQPDQQPGHPVPGPLAPRRWRGAGGRRRACHGPLPRPGHELRLRGLRGPGPPPVGARRGPVRGLRGLPGRAAAQRPGDPAHGAGELPGDARPRRRRRLPAAAGPRGPPRAPPPGALRAALLDGHLPPHALRPRPGARQPAARTAGRAHPRPRQPGTTRLGTRRPAGTRAPGAAAARPRTAPRDRRGSRRLMAASFLFYDLETFGTDPRRNRIAQFAAI